MQIQARNRKENKLIKKTIESGNNEVFFFWNGLNDDEKDALINDLAGIELNKTMKIFKKIQAVKVRYPDLRIPDLFALDDRKNNPLLLSYGINTLKKGEVAYLTVAGGQGTRLNFDHPKGCFPITPVKQKALFRLFAEKIRFITQYYVTKIKWFIMTSGANDTETREYFHENGFFGIEECNVIFFTQNMIPSLTLDGKLILSEKNRIFRNPDGHGGALKALMNTGLLKKMSEEGIKYLYYFQVDNPLADLNDTLFLGYHIGKRSQVTSKVIKKSGPQEKLGVAVKLINGKNAVIEYSDMSEKNAGELDERGNLKYAYGSIGIHIFNVEFLSKFTKNIPVHCAIKQIEAYRMNADNMMEQSVFECMKLEYFVFDVIPLAKKTAFFECDRTEEFSPLKNQTGNDSILTCKNGQSKKFFSWLKEAGLVPNASFSAEKTSVEISPLYAPDRNIFLEKAAKDSDNLKKTIFDNNGNLKNEIYIE